MPETDSNRKRSRSPSDSDPPKQYKRANTGAASISDDATASTAASGDVTMVDAHSTAADDNTGSTPGSNHSKNKSGDARDGKSSSATTSGEPSSSSAPPPPSAMIHMRCLIVTQDASIIIGKGGTHVNEIREKSGARVVVSESIPGNPERILNVSGPLDAVSKAFGLIVRRINDEPFDVPSVPGSRAVTIKFMIPNSRMGSVIGKQGSKIKEIQDASGARLNASEGMLPGSTERVLSVAGVADAIHIATYYIGNILIEAQERNPSSSSSHSSYRPSSNSRRSNYGGSSYVPGYSNTSSSYPNPSPHNPPQQLQTQQIYIPNDLVGCIIGKGGSKINEIRHMSASQIKIMEPGAVGVGMNGGPAPTGGEGERLVVITGQPTNIQMAVQLLYHIQSDLNRRNRSNFVLAARRKVRDLVVLHLAWYSPPLPAMASILKAQKANAKADSKGKRKVDDMDVDQDTAIEAPKKKKNKQRVLLLSSRGVTHRMRHLMNDLEALLPHVKKDSKLDSKSQLHLLPELADLNNCNNALYFEARRHEDLYLWAAKTPNGPSIKMHVQNVHTMDELKMTGNCLKGSRGLLSFDQAFDETEWGRLTKEVFTQASHESFRTLSWCIKRHCSQIFGVPSTARKAKPFIDHILTFSLLDSKIWFRNFQIIEKDPLQPNGPPQTSLVEIGPRFVLTPIRIFEGAFGGATVFSNPEFVSPTAVRSALRREKGAKYGQRKQAEEEIQKRKTMRKREEDALAVHKVFA
ncbi:hypothetical protein H0H93_012266 [Arthromyces matolae]|nr:hypothetical protein H0H93_012266 [Arthromyces matolae]